MKALIFSGGTGSIALQTGFNIIYNDLIDVQVMTNAYDSGKSTGLVREVYDGKILGPSDLRKNQTTQYKLAGGMSSIIDFLEHRFTCETKDANNIVLAKVHELYISDKIVKQSLLDAVNHFFNRPKSKQIPYNDFSLANIVYAGLAGLNGNSLAKAGKIMANFLGLKEDSVILNDDTSLFLKAKTESGYNILDEGELVEWNNEKDKITRVYFEDEMGNSKRPTLSDEAWDAINSADIIIFSAGTQWSSLIPTYMSTGFNGAMTENIDKKMFLVINNEPDKDMKGVDINELLKTLSDFIPVDNCFKIFNNNAHPLLRLDKLTRSVNCYEFELSNNRDNKKHKLGVVSSIMSIYYEKYIKNSKLIFDYDDTLVGRNNEYKKESAFNMMSMLQLQQLGKETFIFTGNYIKAVDFNFDFNSTWLIMNPEKNIKKILNVYADGGVNLYNVTFDSNDGYKMIVDTKLVRCLDKHSLFSNQEVNIIINEIETCCISASKIQNRNNATLSIKPIDDEYRKSICLLLKNHLDKDLNIRPTGRTSIDISKKNNTKTLALDDMLDRTVTGLERVTYVGDELHDGGNDHVITNNDNVDYLHVNNPKDTKIFISTVINLLALQDEVFP